MNIEMSYVSPGTATCRAGEEVSVGGFVKGVVIYMVKDNLEMTPMSTISCITLLNKFNVKDLGSLEERVVDFGIDEVLFDRLASRDLLGFVSQLKSGVDLELEKWKDTLSLIEAVLSDAEEKQLTDKAVKIWLDNLRDFAYDAEDVLDEFGTRALEHKLMHGKVQKLVDSINPSTFKFHASMRSKIKSLTRRLEQLCQKRIELGLQLTTPAAGLGTSSSSSVSRALSRSPSSSVPTERVVFGRDEDKAKILEMVLSEEPSDPNLFVIPIVGMAGVGKTTLAREVYNDKAVHDSKFEIKAWVCVSDDFDVLSISRSLLEAITSKHCDLKTLNQVQVQLRDIVAGKKVLLVLDDVWNEDYNLWEELKAPFLAAAPNSKIIVTTRHSCVASIMGPIEHYNLKHLSDDDCWSLFMNRAFEGRDINAQQISEFRDRVVGKCGGLPLSAKALGGLYRSNGVYAWDDILNCNILNFPQHNGILPVLQLSYYYLPSHLKRCFAYCAIFPKDYEFSKMELVLLWMAEGIIQLSVNNKELEDWGSKYFDDLVSRSIFQHSNTDSSKFIMHDLLHDLAQVVSGETILRLEEANKHSGRFKRVRHSSYSLDQFEDKIRFEIFYEVEHLRTFLPLVTRSHNFWSYTTNSFLHDVLPRFKKLRVLSLEDYYFFRLPISFEDLKLLKYLNLAGSMIKSLPESTSSLLNLQILILRNCRQLMKLPSKMRNLISLCHLDIKGANSLKEMPLGMKQLKNLHTLSNFILGKGENVSTLKDLKNLIFLRGELCITGLENLSDLEDAREAALWEKQYLQTLSLQWGSQFDNTRDEKAEEKVLNTLQPHGNIKRLEIGYYGGAEFPLWIGDGSFSKIEVLTLENSRTCKTLPSLGLLKSLKHLTIRALMKLESISSEFYGAGCSKRFQVLETLRFDNLPKLKYWDTNIKENEEIEIFSSLGELSIVGCPRLSGKLPDGLTSLQRLVVSRCANLVVPASSYPNLCKLEIDECKGMVCRSSPIDFKSIECMTISNSSLKLYGCAGMLYNDSPTGLSVTISNILEFGKYVKQGFQVVDSLAIGSYPAISFWNFSGAFTSGKAKQGLNMHTNHEEVLFGENCVGLTPFPELKFPPNNLRIVKIENSGALNCLPKEIMSNNSQLEKLYVSSCHSLTFITRRKLPSSLKRLEISRCHNLERLVDDEEDASSSEVVLNYLRVSDCPKLTTLSLGVQLLEALEYLDIEECHNLESLPNGLHRIHCLKWISLWNCSSLVFFPEGGLPKTISEVSLEICGNLKALPDDMHKLNSLRYLHICDCPSIESFPKEGFPTSLTSLAIENLKVCKPLIQRGIHRLTSLTFLSIDGCNDLESFRDQEIDGMMLPTSLTHLRLCRFRKLKYLSSTGFHRLTSLECLEICVCPELKSFGKVDLPVSLLKLEFYGCPLLKKQCKRYKGKEWSKIAHIPCVRIDGKFTHDPDYEKRALSNLE
ncbi:Disease resistance protein [Melia azedarach]|uniref:Disease resistance protein n=1 Tax=Melia azedarach TaxID=155640 RepID=A0ACC1YJE1_MELAZ|nr:Disease resistance protein [Melia azedarach]